MESVSDEYIREVGHKIGVDWGNMEFESLCLNENRGEPQHGNVC